MNYSKDGITVAAILDTRRERSSGGYPVKIRVTYRRMRTYFNTGKNLSIEEWDRLNTTRLHTLLDIRKDIENSFDLVKAAVKDLSDRGDFSIVAINNKMRYISDTTLNACFESKINDLSNANRINTRMFYENALASIHRYFSYPIALEEVTVGWLRKFEDFLLKEGKTQTTVAITMRLLRAVVNDAKKAGLIKESQYPFGQGKYEIREGEGRKMALTLEQIGEIARYDNGDDTFQRSRDYWLFLYLCNGINVADFVQLKFKDIVNNEIYFSRKKTEYTSRKRKEIRVVISDPMRAIINRYGNEPRPENYIFPVLNGKEDAVKTRIKVKDLTRFINYRMNKIGEELGFGKISTYTARHSFATVLKRAGANISYISESLGHSDIRTTEHYLASFEREEREKNAQLLTQF